MNRRSFLAAAAAAVVVPERALGGGSPTLLVTADLEAHVVALDASTGRVLRRIRTLPGPRSIESAFANWTVIAHTALGRVSVIRGVDLRVRHTIGGFVAPRYTAMLPRLLPEVGGPLAYVTDSGRGEVVTLDVERGRVLWRTRVPGPARHVTVSPTGELLWTALGSKAERIAVLDLEDPRRPRLARTFVPPFLAHDVVCSPGWVRLWVTSGGSQRLAIYEIDGRRPDAVLEAGAPPQHIAFNGPLASVASGDDGTVRLHGPDGAILGESRVPHGSYNVTRGWGGVVTPSLGRGTVAFLDDHGRVRRVRRVARAAHDACLVVTA